MESHKRTIAKALTWRVSAFTITTALAWWITGKMELAASIGLLDSIIKLGAYYGHERMWLKLSYGQKKENWSYEI